MSGRLMVTDPSPSIDLAEDILSEKDGVPKPLADTNEFPSETL